MLGAERHYINCLPQQVGPTLKAQVKEVPWSTSDSRASARS